MATLFLRTLVIYVVLLAAIRLMGKRQVGQLEVSELVITFLLSELAVLPLSNIYAPLSHALIPTLVLLSAEVISSFISSKSMVFRRIVIGKPSMIINKGIIDQRELSRLRISVSELISELRLKGAASVSDVEYAIAEDNGQLSVFLRRQNDGERAASDGIDHCLVADGKICADGLRESGVSRAWLDGVLSENKTAAADVFLMTIDDGGNTNIILKEKGEKSG